MLYLLIISILILAWSNYRIRLTCRPPRPFRIRPTYSTMTVQDRIDATGLRTDFDKAVACDDMKSLIAILMQVDIPFDEARNIAGNLVEETGDPNIASTERNEQTND